MCSIIIFNLFINKFAIIFLVCLFKTNYTLINIVFIYYICKILIKIIV